MDRFLRFVEGSTMDWTIIKSIRILPSDKGTFPTEQEYKLFIQNTVLSRGGYYYFPSSMMKCPENTLVLFQYAGMIRATGVLIDLAKEKKIDERGVEYAGYYKFDVDTVRYLANPISKEQLKSVYPEFRGFNQTKHIIPLDYLLALKSLLQDIDPYYQDDSVAIVDTIERELEASGLQGESRDAVIKARVNQGVFRDRLMHRYSECCLCGVSNPNLLIASHIKPWVASDPDEKLDIENGFLMCPNHDRLFDQGWITFSDDGEIIISEVLSQTDRIFMNVRENMKIELTEENVTYLQYHRKYIFDGKNES